MKQLILRVPRDGTVILWWKRDGALTLGMIREEEERG